MAKSSFYTGATPIDEITSSASDYADASAASAAAAAGYYNSFRGVYYGAFASDQATDPNGNAPNTGDLYWNTTSSALKIYDGAAWQSYTPSGAPLASPAFTGNPTAPTPTAGDNDTSLATTAFVQTEIASKASTTFVQSALDAQAVQYDSAQSLTTSQKEVARGNVYAAPFDALAFNGMQVNGSMEFSQENGSSSVVFGSGTVQKHVADGVQFVKTGTSVLALQRVASVFPGYNSELKLTVSTAQPTIGTDVAYFLIPIEGYRFSRAMWGTSSAVPVTVGFWAKSSVGGDIVLGATDNVANNVPQQNVTLVANTAKWVTYTLPAQTTWVGSTTSGLGMYLVVYVASAALNIFSSTSNTFEITGLIVLPGIELPSSTRAPSIMRPFDQELQLCRRYFQQFSGAAAIPIESIGWAFNSTIGVFSVRLTPHMRVLPALSVSANSDWNVSAISMTGISIAAGREDVAQLNTTVASGLTAGNAIALQAANSNARMKFDARL